MSDKFTIRPLTSTDIPAVRALHTSLLPTFTPLHSAFFTQLITHPTRICLLAFPSSSSLSTTSPAPIAFISASLQIPTSDLSRTRPTPADAQITVLTLGVDSAYRRQRLATRLVRAAIQALRSQAKSAPQVPAGYSLPSNTSSSDAKESNRVHATMTLAPPNGNADRAARAFWTQGVGLVESVPREPWMTGWRDVVRVEGRVAA